MGGRLTIINGSLGLVPEIDPVTPASLFEVFFDFDVGAFAVYN